MSRCVAGASYELRIHGGEQSPAVVWLTSLYSMCVVQVLQPSAESRDWRVLHTAAAASCALPRSYLPVVAVNVGQQRRCKFLHMRQMICVYILSYMDVKYL